jgi:hypothetical protein
MYAYNISCMSGFVGISVCILSVCVCKLYENCAYVVYACKYVCMHVHRVRECVSVHMYMYVYMYG